MNGKTADLTRAARLRTHTPMRCVAPAAATRSAAAAAAPAYTLRHASDLGPLHARVVPATAARQRAAA